MLVGLLGEEASGVQEVCNSTPPCLAYTEAQPDIGHRCGVLVRVSWHEKRGTRAGSLKSDSTNVLETRSQQSETYSL
ncbi:unnamed protein product [Caenorhabditis bovis]|uniref:Uncharacterized protein n=1 Tax=Caenorhabditis bovis TaxID=2654633 RepID=A0A8S1F7I8_9PELO|nr:unnamed protein product [Caenorhabditis bovis]